MSSWNGLDFFILLIFFLNTILGMSRGATKEIISLMCLSLALIFTIKFTVPMADFLNRSPLIQDVLTASMVQNFMAAIGADPLTANLLQQISYSISLLICFVGVFSITDAVLNTSFAEVFTFPYAVWNRKVGAALGCVRGYVISLILILILGHIFSHNNRVIGDSLVSNSYFVGMLTGSVQRLDNIIIGQDVDRYPEVFKDSNVFNAEKVLKQVTPQGVIPQVPVGQ